MMGKVVIGFGLWIWVVFAAECQSYRTVKSETSFFSSAPLENIRAVNKEGTGLFNAKSGNIAFRIPIRGFQFRIGLMQRHFNENFMESDEFPNATFQGKLIGYDMEKRGSQQVEAVGNMTIHGVTQKMTIPGEFVVSDQHVLMDAKFEVRVEDFDIRIPRVVIMNIAEVVEVTTAFQFQEIK